MDSEHEAKKKWCPLARVVSWDRDTQSTVAGNRIGHDVTSAVDESTVTTSARCIASECMMWRWFQGKIVGDNDDGPIYAPTGYCGFGDKPET